MKQGREFVDYLRDIVEHADGAIEFVVGILDARALEADRRTFWAVIRALEVIGEAARRIPPEFRQAHPQIAWRGMTGMRDKVIHDYFGVDAAVVWQTVKDDLPLLSESVRRILAELESEDKSPSRGAGE